MEMSKIERTATQRQVWNAGRTVGAKRALKPKQIWEIRFYLNQHRRLRDRALFDLAIDSKLHGCELVRMKIGDVVSGGQVRTRAIVMQQKTGRQVQFELLADARASLLAWLERRGGTVDDYAPQPPLPGGTLATTPSDVGQMMDNMFKPVAAQFQALANTG